MGVFDRFRWRSSDRHDGQLAFVADNKQPSKKRLSDAEFLGRQIVRSADARENVIASDKRIDPAFAVPGANWSIDAPNDYMDRYRRIRSLSEDCLLALRLECQNFSGNNLPSMTISQGMPRGAKAAENFERQWTDETRESVLEHWRALVTDLDVRYILDAPNMLGECGWWWRNRIVNVDVVDYQERISLIHAGGLFKRLTGRRPRILEIGGGYGAIALALVKMMSASEYVICDLPESLLFSGLYLSLTQDRPVTLYGEPGTFKLLPNYLAQAALVNQRFDLVINTLSMSEMSEHQVRTYAALISKAIGSGGIFFEQNHDNRDAGMINCRDYLGDYFRQYAKIDAGSLPVTRGVPVVWSN